eukprot:TRINITY_DN696_c0_g1_i2.p1 TRINITY_DN696_c0_g1~~TRINITY_DN696_c0_g1_i2.p1  ORF type:complete len:252 (-),score=43.09 TRINITY_DN696_c0_g1_i2:727-1482(-)
MRLSLLLFLFFFSLAASDENPKKLKYSVVGEYPHDRNAYTQGLIVIGDVFYESTGLYGQSSLRKVNLTTGQVIKSVSLPKEDFGEGLTLLGDFFYQLTWKENKIYKYDRDFNLVSTIPNPRFLHEGWGITENGEEVIISDGSDNLRFYDPTSFSKTDRVKVTLNGRPVQRLNELEIVDDLIWANIYYSRDIVAIDPESGKVRAYLDLSGLNPGGNAEVLNGIAFDKRTRRLFVTGKLWPKMYELKVDTVNK